MTKKTLGIWSGRKTKGRIFKSEEDAPRGETDRLMVEQARWHPTGTPPYNKDTSVLWVS